MADIITLQGEARERTGKGGARALRREGRLPGIIYGGKGEPRKIALNFKDIKRELSHNPRFFSTVFDIDVDGTKEHVLPREAQFHPVTSDPLHVDFLRAEKGAKVTVAVPVHFLNEARCPGLRRGGVLNIVRREIDMLCPADAIPGEIGVDLIAFDIGESIHISHVTLPEGVTPTITDRDFTIASIVPPTVSAEVREEEGGEAREESEG